MIKFSKARYITPVLSLLIIIGAYWYTFGTHGGYAQSMDFDGGVQLEIEFPTGFGESEVREFFTTVEPPMDVTITRYADSNRNIYKVETGRDVIDRITGNASKKSDASFWSYVKTFIGGESIDDLVESASAEAAKEDAEKQKKKEEKKKNKKDKKKKAKAAKGKDKAVAGTTEQKPEAVAGDPVVKLKEIINKAWGGSGKEKALIWHSANNTGPTMGVNLRGKGVSLLFVTMLFIIVYLTVRFEFRFGVAALVALLHDLLLVWGLVGMMQIKPSIPLIAALLTILGYSINDTIVIFDRVRENMRGNRKMAIKAIIDKSINQSISRTLVTSITTLVSVTCLYYFGGLELADFSFVLILGIFIGTYSSLFIASPVLIIWDRIRTFQLPDLETTQDKVEV